MLGSKRALEPSRSTWFTGLKKAGQGGSSPMQFNLHWSLPLIIHVHSLLNNKMVLLAGETDLLTYVVVADCWHMGPGPHVSHGTSRGRVICEIHSWCSMHALGPGETTLRSAAHSIPFHIPSRSRGRIEVMFLFVRRNFRSHARPAARWSRCLLKAAAHAVQGLEPWTGRSCSGKMQSKEEAICM